MKPILSPKVSLDGQKIRRIREEKKLTQLYVAKVVGVTTDTISRWENNRYPSVKRENLERLAEALEVDAAELLEGAAGSEPQETEQEVEVGGTKRSGKPFWPVFLMAVLAIAAASYFFWRGSESPEAVVSAERLLPAFAAPGGIIPVRVRLEVGPELKGFILREHFPSGWQLIEANPPPSSLDNEEGTARWIVKPDETQRLVTYLIKVAEKARIGENASFSGEVVANPNGRSEPMPVNGTTQLSVAPFIWADLNGDQVVDDAEMLMASDTIDEMKGVHLDWNQLEKIWDAGGYRWEEERQHFMPYRPSTPTAD